MNTIYEFSPEVLVWLENQKHLKGLEKSESVSHMVGINGLHPTSLKLDIVKPAIASGKTLKVNVILDD